MPSVTRKAKSGPSRREAAGTNVLEAVERLLADGAGYTELGVQQIAEAAGISRSTFYVHFTDKNDLLVRLTRASTAELFAAADAWLARPYEEGIGPLEEALAEVCAQRRKHSAALNALAEVASYDPAIGEFWRAQINAFADRFARRLAADKRAGHTAPGLDARNTAMFLTWGVERAFEQQMIGGQPSGDAKLVRATARSLWLTIYGQAGELGE